MSNIVPRYLADLDHEITSRPMLRQTYRSLDKIEARSVVRQALVEAEAEHAAYVIQARNAGRQPLPRPTRSCPVSWPRSQSTTNRMLTSEIS